MDGNNVIIKFHGMKQKEKPRHLLDYLDSLLCHAPSNSTCQCHIFKESKGYLCKLTVHSNIKTFSAHSKDENMKTAIKTVLRSVKSQIAYWKKNRSSMELTGVTSITRLNLNALEEEDELTAAEEEEEQSKKKRHKAA